MPDVEFLRKLRGIENQLKVLTLDRDLFRFEPKYSEVMVPVAAGIIKKVLSLKEEGILTMFNITVTSKDAEILLFLDDNRIEGRPSEVYEEGMTYFNPRSFWISKYDEINNRYTLWYTPIPYIHYYDRIEISVRAPSGESLYYKYRLYRFVRR